MLALLLAAALLQPAPSDPPGRFAFRSYGSEQGLENLSVVAIVQDREGYLWVGTEDRIYRYDGDRFHPYGADEGMPSNKITSLALGDDGRLWVGTSRGVACFVEGRFRPTAGRLAGVPIKALAVAPGGVLWVATSVGLFVERGVDDFIPAPGWKPGLAATALWADAGSLVTAAQGALYVQRAGQWSKIAVGSESIDAVVRDRKGTIWARSARHLSALYEGRSIVEDFSNLLPGTSDVGYLGLDSKDSLWVPTDSGLLYRDDDQWKVLGPEQGLPSSWARVALQDREGSVWIGATGLHRLVGRGLWRVYSTLDGLPSEVVWTEWRDAKGTLHVGTDRGVARASGGRFERVPGTEGHAIRTIAQTPDGAIWMGGSPPELLRLKDGVVERFGREAGVTGLKVLNLLVTREGELLAGTDAGGLLQLEGRRFVPLTVPGGSVQERFSHLIEDRAGRVWAAGDLGLVRRQKGEWRRFTEADGLRDVHVSYLLERRSGDLCVAYFEALGFSCFQVTPQGQLRRPQHVGLGNGLQNDLVYQLGEDRNGRLWAGTGQGADVFDAHGVEHFGGARGMAGDDCDATGFLADANGDVWIATSTGLGRFIGSNYAGPPEPPQAVIVEAAVGGTKLLGGAVKRVDEKAPVLQVHFAGLSFLDETRVQHQIRLLPVESQFRATNVREARYAALSPGGYVFEVRARMAPGEWSKPARLEFVLLPQWWQAIWFRLLVAALGLAAAGAVVSWRLHGLERRNRDLKQQIDARTGELAAANQALRDLAVSDPLTGLKNRRYLELTMPETVGQVMRAQRQRLHNADLLIALVDLDDFKNINDTLGHAAGDRVLQEAALLIAQACRDSDSAVRWGGEEFMVVARQADRAQAPTVAERVCELFRQHRFDVGGGKSIGVTCSVGLAAFPFAPEADLSWEAVVDLADHGLYAAKRAGKDCWAMVTPASPLAVTLKRHDDFAQLVASGQLVLTLSKGQDPPERLSG